MKNISKSLIALTLVLGVLFTSYAQAPYKQGIGASVGNMQALTYKVFGSNHFAFQLDLGTKFITTDGRFRNLNLTGVSVWTFELNPNFIFEGHFTKGLYGLVGVGGSIGYSWNTLGYQGFFGVWHTRSDFGKCGANGIFGLEYKFNAPVALQFDFRPGYGCLFAEGYDFHYFDWGVNLGVRYTF